MPRHTPQTPQNETGLALGLSLIGLLIALLIAVFLSDIKSGPIQAGPGGIVLGIYLMDWGIMFLASYYYSHKSFFLRALIWICERASYPRDRKMALLYFALATLVGGASVLAGMGVF